MTHDSKRNQGSIALIILIIVLLIAALGFVGLRMLNRQNTDTKAANATSRSSAEVILTKEDLDVAEKDLDELDFSDQDAEAAEVQANL